MAQRRRRDNQRRRGDRLARGIKQDLTKAGNIAQNLLPTDPLPTIDATRQSETQNMLNSLQALADPSFGSYAGARAPEMMSYLDRLNESTRGYDSRETTALREQRRREMERGFQTGRAALARGQNQARVGGVSRSAQLMNLASQYGAQSAAAENDLIANFANEKQRRLETYGDSLRQARQNEFDRGQIARESYADALRNSQLDEFEKQKVNLGQAAANQAIQSAGILGVAGMMDARRNSRRQNKLMRDIYGQRQQTGRTGGGSNTSYADELDKIANDVQGGKYY